MTREVFWNIGSEGQLLFYGLSALALVIFFAGVFRIVWIWRSSWGEQRRRDVAGSARRSIVDSLLCRRIFRGDVLGGLAHFLMLWGWILLFTGTALLTVHQDLSRFLDDGLYLAYSLAMELAGIAFIGGVSLAAIRRYVLKTNRTHTLWDDSALLILLFLIATTGFLVEGTRLSSIAGVGREWSPVGDLMGTVLQSGFAANRDAHLLLWWVHTLSALGLIAYVPYSKLFHAFSGPINLYLGSAPLAVLTVEEREALRGEFDRTQLVSLDACVRCNRCEMVCPSYAAGEPLSPRQLVLSTKSYVRLRHAPERLLLPWKRKGSAEVKLDSAVDRGECWYCTTCLACASSCPMGVNPAEIARETRAGLLESGRTVPRTIRDLLNTVGKHGNPWESRGAKRFNWLKSLGTRDFTQGDSADLCLYLGNLASGDVRNQDVAKALVKVLDAAAVEFATLGHEEVYCGEDVRRLGEDGLFETLVEGNYEVFQEFEIRDLVTTSPHCFHTIGHEFPALREKLKLDGAPAVAVRHHTMLLAELVREGRLSLRGGAGRLATYHDPCYLGRHSGIYDEPREVLRAIPGLRLVEMPRSRESSFCCGGGGGRMWLESDAEQRIAELRIEEAHTTGAEVLVTACPYCLSNLEDAIKVRGYADRMEVKDIVELVADAI